jgi:opacity protein-like surface antigen
MVKRTAIVLMIGAILACTSLALGADIGFKGAHLRVGYVMPEDPIESTIGFGGGVDLGTITENIGLEVQVFYWSKSYEVGTAEWTYSDLAIKAHGKYMFPMEKFTPYVGGGIGFHMYSFEWEQPEYTTPYGTYGGGTFDDSETKIGFHFLGGLVYPFNDKISLIVEAEYDLADLDQFIIGGGVGMRFGQ